MHRNRVVDLSLFDHMHPDSSSPDSMARSVRKRRDDLERLERLTQETRSIEWRILLYRKHWCLAMDILQTSYGALLRLERALEECKADGAATGIQCRVGKTGSNHDPGTIRWI